MSGQVRSADPPTPDDALAWGDQLARQGAWSAAIAHWRTALVGRQRAEASQRIRWFLDQTEQGSSAAERRRSRQKAYRALLAAAVAAAAGIGVTLIGVGERSALVATVAWMCFIGAMALTVRFTVLLGSNADPPQLLTRDDPAVTIAAERASRIDGQFEHRAP